MVVRFLLAAILSANIVLAGASLADASSACPSSSVGAGCCCPRPERTEEPGVQAPCCCAPGEPGWVGAEGHDPAPPPLAHDGGGEARQLDAAEPLLRRGRALAADDPFGPPIARYLLLGCVRR